jgi:uncharacterized protein (TIGR04255 family)
MSKIRKLEKPPIVESVIEFQFQPFLEFDKQKLQNVKNALIKNYINSNFIESKQIDVGLNQNFPPKVIESPPQLMGIRLQDDKRGFVIQFLRDRLSLSKIKLYHDFEELLNEFFIIFENTREFIKENKINRIGLRYINEFSYKNDFYRYLESNPFSISNSNGILRTYNQSIFGYDDTEGAILNYVLDIKEKKITIDIDVFSLIINDINKINKIRIILEKLRKRKNNLFFSIITKYLEEVL